jgi:hypothetical protein
MLEKRLALPAIPEGFGEHDLAELPEPARRHLRASIAPGAPLARTTELHMRGRIKLGRWLPFRASQTLTPAAGFWWDARVAGLITGWDRLLDGAGAMRWRLAGIVPLSSADGPDVTRSAAARAAGESIWLPSARLPRTGVTWTSEGPDEATAHHRLGDTTTVVTHRLDPDGRILSLSFDRWGDPDGTGQWGWHRFGGDVTGHRRFGDLLIPRSGRVGWHHGTDRWPAGAFFEFVITSARPVLALEAASPME